jgi:hypothetical protein
MSIGALAKEAGVKVPTIRYYEQIGLLEAPPRTDGQQRRYDPGAVRRLNFIRHAAISGSTSKTSANCCCSALNRIGRVRTPTKSRLDIWMRWTIVSASSRPYGTNSNGCWTNVTAAAWPNAGLSRASAHQQKHMLAIE